MPRALFLPAVLVLFTASGFAGLIYESVWSHYLRLFLGHAAYAQTLVLAIFMGGMALGAWLASRISARWSNLLLAYALIEVLIGVASLGFHPVFVAATGAAFDRVIPALGSPAAVHAFKWTLAALLLAPQAMLLGMTFPLMTGGVLRMRPERSGWVIAMLYFTNSLGAALGVLASGFYFIGAVGLPGTLTIAASLNLVVAAGVVLLRARPSGPPPAPAGETARTAIPRHRLLLAVAALTGMSSFMYEIGWIRMLVLVLGGSTHAFELMLSAFILGLAFGGLWVRRRIDAAADSVRLLGWVQLAMGVAALATLPVYGSTFRLMQGALAALTPTAAGYAAFNLVSHGICLAVMFPAAFCAGMTLPLITVSLLRAGAGERAIGQVYAANTAGAIAGVIVAVHLALPLLGLRGLIVAGAVIDLALAVVLLGAGRSLRLAGGAAALGTAAVAAALFVRLDAHDMASGVFRHGHLIDRSRINVVTQLDGKTATVSVTGDAHSLSLRTNGKSDGSVRIDGGEPVVDEITMTLLGALPQLLAPEARRVANIGFGTGMTAHVLLASRTFEVVETVEIEPAIVQASATHLRAANRRALEDPRGRLFYDDAKTYFSSRRARYDVIVSEPSNPWVSGVASLFTVEFYRDLRRYLKDGGLFVQWVQLYEMSPQLLATVVRALHENFTDYEFWMANYGDLIIVAANGGEVPRADARAFDNPELRSELARFHIRGLDDLHLHRIGGRAALAPYFASFGAPVNSDFFPVLEVGAPLARYLRLDVDDMLQLLESSVPLLELFYAEVPRPHPARLTPGQRPWWQRVEYTHQARHVREFLRSGNREALAPFGPELAGDLVMVRAALVQCQAEPPAETLALRLASLARFLSAHLPAEERKAIWTQLAGSRCAARLGASVQRWLRLHAAVADGAPPAMVDTAAALLDREPNLQGRMLAHALAVYMTGQVLMQQGTSAMQAYAKHGARLGAGAGREWQPVFRFLVAHAGLAVPPPLPTSKANGGA